MKNNFVPLKKQSKKAQKAAAAAGRGSWLGVKPVTKIVPDTKKEKLEKIKKKETEGYI